MTQSSWCLLQQPCLPPLAIVVYTRPQKTFWTSLWKLKSWFFKKSFLCNYHTIMIWLVIEEAGRVPTEAKSSLFGMVTITKYRNAAIWYYYCYFFAQIQVVFYKYFAMVIISTFLQQSNIHERILVEWFLVP